jgi:hypothetical protein
MGEAGRDLLTLALAFIGLAAFALLVSPSAQTSSVVSTVGNAFNATLATAEGPVTGYTPQAANTGIASLLNNFTAPEPGSGYNVSDA